MTTDSEPKPSHPPGDQPAPEGLALPHRMGNYELTEEIASGGSGVVYRARQIDLGRTVAIKVLRAGTLATEDEVHRFHAEAEAAARLDHSSIVPVYEVGAHEGRPFISMKLVDGPGLDRCIDRYRDDQRAAAALVARVARAVDHGHRHAVLHRDVKPSNVLLDEDGTPYVVDFGTAKLLDAGEGRTVTGSIIGTPYYMAPEQVAAKGDVTVATDVYGLGCVLYELIVGRPPLVAEGLIETLQLVVEAEPTPIRSMRPEIHRDLATICHTCLAKDPARRYASALALAEDLERWLAFEPIRARPTTRIERMWLAARRKPLVAALLAAIALLSVTLVVGTVVTGLELRARLGRTRAAEDVARKQLRGAYLAEARVVRASKTADRRARGLDLIRRAAEIRPGTDLVNEAVASLALTDLVVEREWKRSPDRFWMEFDPAFERYVQAGLDGRLELRRVADDALLQTLIESGEPSWRWRFSRDGRYFTATQHSRYGWKEPRFNVWDLSRKEIVYSIDRLPSTGRVDFVPGRPEVVLSLEDGRLFARNLESGNERTVARFDEDDPPYAVAFDPGGERLAVSCAEARSVSILSVTGELLKTLEGPEKAVYSLAWSPDGTRLVAGSHDFHAYVWHVESGKLVTTIRRHRAEVANVFFPLPHLVVTCSWDGTSRLWDLKTGEQLLWLEEKLVAFAADGRRFAGWTDDLMRVRRLTHTKVMHRLHGHTGKGPFCLDVSPDDRWAASGGPEELLLWDLDSGTCVDRRSVENVQAVLFHDDALYVGTDDRLERFEIRDGRLSGEPLELASGKCRGLDCDRDGDLIVAAMGGGIHLFYPREPERNFRFERPRGATRAVVSPDGEWVAAGSWRGSGAHIWRTSNAALVAHLEPAASTCHVNFSPDGRRVIVAVPGEYHIHAVGSWTRERSWRGGTGLGGTRHSPDGRILAATLGSWEFGLVDAATGTEMMRLIPPRRQIANDARFSRDLRRIFVATDLNRILVWDLQRLQSEFAANGIEALFFPSVGAAK